ncbi:7-carboxy-7-deazaguanine synthase [Limnohabitans sp. TEGF004]|uniref:7-carboxy-7-deazaguanine synthase n=1 Tax=Limnohabitans sp. TEGF004 TaxID=2986281 RepID=UPI002376F77A|nr:7-carboxy-7-deazaguanine synthase [Limnohabitans sp. TEGF004]BDU55930.1 7-carboxy-7-deazaguanine synthase [Limnohabitans sp. TEGF004]
MTYSVKEMFYTLQGEGANAGQPAVFCRFAGCNLWSGREEDRSTAICQFCDTDFVGTDGTHGGKIDNAQALASAIASFWPASDTQHRFVVLTGGEPLLQVDEALVDALHAQGFSIAVETNGTVLPPKGIDWLCMSPKAGSQRVVDTGQELKLVFPQVGAEPALYEALNFENFYLQPMDGPNAAANTAAAVAYCQANPRWRLSVQTHKLIGIR